LFVVATTHHSSFATTRYTDHIVYFKKGTWTPVQVYDKQQEQTGILGGLTHYSNCVEGKNATAYNVPASCFHWTQKEE
jgi:hypothetical protein